MKEVFVIVKFVVTKEKKSCNCDHCRTLPDEQEVVNELYYADGQFKSEWTPAVADKFETYDIAKGVISADVALLNNPEEKVFYKIEKLFSA